MSKYHPIDVRHPSNRAFMTRNFLLDPPGPDLTQPPRQDLQAEPRPTASSATTAASAAATRAAARTDRRAQGTVAPWGDALPASVSNRRAGRPTSLATTTAGAAAPRKRSGWLSTAFFIGIALWIFAGSDTGLWRDLMVQLRLWAANNGIPLPF